MCDFLVLSVLSVEVELLIYAHDCHTLACNMEGISSVLRAAQSLVDSLHTAEEYNLMVRKLVIARPHLFYLLDFVT